MGSRGPVPKHPDQRRRRNVKKAAPVKKAAKKSTAKASDVTTLPTPPRPKRVPVPRAQAGWHPVALAWYKSLADSGQSKFYQPSDWATAVLIAESMSRDLNPQMVSVLQEGPSAGEVVMEIIPLKGASLAAYLKAMSLLLVTEGDRRRMELVLDQPGQAEDPEAKRAKATVTSLQSRLGG